MGKRPRHQAEVADDRTACWFVVGEERPILFRSIRQIQRVPRISPSNGSAHQLRRDHLPAHGSRTFDRTCQSHNCNGLPFENAAPSAAWGACVKTRTVTVFENSHAQISLRSHDLEAVRGCKTPSLSTSRSFHTPSGLVRQHTSVPECAIRMLRRVTATTTGRAGLAGGAEETGSPRPSIPALDPFDHHTVELLRNLEHRIVAGVLEQMELKVGDDPTHIVPEEVWSTEVVLPRYD